MPSSLLVVCSKNKLQGTVKTLSEITDYTMIFGMPIMDIQSHPYQMPEGVEAIFLTSSAPIQYIQHHNLPTYCVGEKTALDAKKAGFNVIYTGKGGAMEMAEALADKQLPACCWHPTTKQANTDWYTLLYKTTIIPSFVYTQIMEAEMPATVLHQFESIEDILLLSSNGAAHFCELVAKDGLDVSAKRCIAMSKQVLDAVTLPFGKTVTLPSPTLEAVAQIK